MPACLLAWLLPGAGHFYLGRIGKGLLFLGSIGALFLLGIAMDARLQDIGMADPLAFFVGPLVILLGLALGRMGAGARSEIVFYAAAGLGLVFLLRLFLRQEDPLGFLRSLAQMAIGLPYFGARALGFAAGRITSVTHEYGNTFTEVGGLLNILVMLDAHDTALGRKP